MIPCKVHKEGNHQNDKLMKKAYCIDPSINFLRGNYNTEQITSSIMQVKAIKCDKKNDPKGIFAKVPKCATKAEMKEFIKNNVFVAVEENKIDYKSAQEEKETGVPYMRRHRLIKYDHLTLDTERIDSYQIDLQSNEVRYVNAGFFKHPSRYFLNSQSGIIKSSYE